MHFADSVVEIVNAVALVCTLLVVCLYTRFTYRIAKLQEEEIGLRKRPVVSILNELPKDLSFRTLVSNHSNVHTELLVAVRVTWDGTQLVLPQDHLYDGHHLWRLQPREELHGHLDLENVAQQKGSGRTIPQSARITFDVRVRNAEPDMTPEPPFSKAPPIEYYWEGGVWIPEASPGRSIVRQAGTWRS